TNSDNTEMVLDSDNHYNPVFRLKGHIENSVR
ncbi:N-acetylglutamate synthase, partial [Vibrio splendidus]